MQWRAADENEHKAVCKQIRNHYRIYLGMFIPILPLVAFFLYLSIRNMIEDGETEAMVPVLVIFAFMFLGTAGFVLFMMRDIIKRIVYISKRRYSVADGTVLRKDKEIRPKQTHHYITVSYTGGKTMKIFVQGNVYDLAEPNKKALTVMYTEPADQKKRLPYDLVIV